MSRAMEITLRTSGIGQASGTLLRLATATNQFSGSLKRIGESGAALKNTGPSERQVDRLERAATAYERLAAAREKLGEGMPVIGAVGAVQARVGASAATASSGTRASDAGKGTGQKLQDAERALADLEAAGAGTAMELRDARVKVARFKAAFEREERLLAGPQPKTPSAAEGAVSSRIGRGPRELMDEIRQELARTDISDARRGDLEDRLFRAERSVVLNERRRADRENSLNRPGLLELFGDLNSLVRDLRSGDVLGVASTIGRRIGFTLANGPGEREGGLNIEQLIAARGAYMIGGRGAAQAAIGASTEAASDGGSDAAGIAAGAAATGALGIIGKIKNRYTLSEFAGLPGVPGGGSAASRIGFALKPFAPLIGVAAGATAAAGALALMAANTKFAAEKLTQIGNAAALSGGSTAGVSRLSAIGIGEGQQAGLAAQLRERLANDPMAIATAGRFEMPRPFGEVDELKGLEREIVRLRSLYDETADATTQLRQRTEQLRQARVLELEAIVPQLLTSERLRRAQLDDAAIRERLFNKKDMARARDFEDSLNRVGFAFETTRLTLGKSLTPYGDSTSNAIANHLNRASETLEKIGPTVGGILDRSLNSLTGGLLDLMRWLDTVLPKPAGQAARDPILEQMDKEYELQMKQFRLLQEGMTGGGANANRAVPGRFRGFKVDEEGRKRDAYYGSITV